jgi:hypothetical protein
MAHLHSHGGLAQLVERLLCKQDVSGSSPLTSTDFHTALALVLFETKRTAGCKIQSEPRKLHKKLGR